MTPRFDGARRMMRRLGLRIQRLRRRILERLEPRLVSLERRLFGQRAERVQEQLPEDAEAPRVLVPVSNPSSAAHLARMAGTVARTRGGVVILLYVEPAAPGAKQPGSEEAPKRVSDWPALSAGLSALREMGVPAGYQVLRAPEVGQALRQAAQQLDASVIVLGWRGDPDDIRPEDTRLATPLRAVLEYPPADVMVVGGQGDELPSKLLVPVSRGQNGLLALELARGLAAESKHVTALKVLPAKARLGQVEAAAQRLREELEDHGAAGMGQLVLRAESRAQGVLDCIERGYDGVVMPSPQEPLLERMLFGKTQMAVASASQVPVVVVKGRSSALTYLGRRIWRLAYHRLPELSEEDRAEVEASIRASASPSIDFFTMIGLSSAIAGFGLLQNSPAVIIGAMLVAPLMSAIIGMGLGVVEGDLTLIRRSGSASLRGALLAIAVGAVLGLLRPNMDPVASEILARTRPNLLDLGVALASGAAGAYALSRKEVSAAMAGVAIAAALVPPLVSSGIGIPLRRWDIFFGALLLYLTNFVAIAASGGIMMLLLGFGPTAEEEEEIGILRRGMQTALAMLLVVALSLGFLTLQTFRIAGSEQISRRVSQVLSHEVEQRSYAHLDGIDRIEVPRDPELPLVVEITLEMPAQVVAEYEYTIARELRDALSASTGRPVELYMSVIPTRRLEPGAVPPSPTPAPTSVLDRPTPTGVPTRRS